MFYIKFNRYGQDLRILELFPAAERSTYSDAVYSLPAALREAQTCRYLVYSEANFEVFRPAGATRCTDGAEIWHGGGDRRSPPPCQISPPSVQR